MRRIAAYIPFVSIALIAICATLYSFLSKEARTVAWIEYYENDEGRLAVRGSKDPELSVEQWMSLTELYFRDVVKKENGQTDSLKKGSPRRPTKKMK